MHKTIAMLLIFMFAACSISKAEQITGFGPTTKELGYGFEEPWANGVGPIRQFNVLVRKIKTIKHCENDDCLERESDLQVSVVVVDNGPSTDVSAVAGLYLAMYNSIEETGVAYSFHAIADVVKMNEAKRVAPGIYEIFYQEFWTIDGCIQPKMKARIDARELSIKVRAAKEVGSLEEHVYADAIDVTYTKLNCPKG